MYVLCALWLALVVTVHALVRKPRPITPDTTHNTHTHIHPHTNTHTHIHPHPNPTTHPPTHNTHTHIHPHTPTPTHKHTHTAHRHHHGTIPQHDLVVSSTLCQTNQEHSHNTTACSTVVHVHGSPGRGGWKELHTALYCQKPVQAKPHNDHRTVLPASCV